MYLTKAIIELIVLVTAYFIVSGMDKRISVLEDKKESKNYLLYINSGKKPLKIDSEENYWKINMRGQWDFYTEDGELHTVPSDKLFLKKNKYPSPTITNGTSLYVSNVLAESSFKDKVTKEEKRIKALKEQNMPKFATNTYTGETKEIKKSKKSSK